MTRRMALVSLTRVAIQNRLEREAFEMVCALPMGEVGVLFPSAWPGEALAMFPRTLQQLPASQDQVPGSFTAVHLETRVAIGQLGTVGQPDPAGSQEIGYGFNPDVRGRGLATEAVRALATHLLTWKTITAVTAQTATSNPASARVLEKAGFQQTGTSWNHDDGDLLAWSLEPSPADVR